MLSLANANENNDEFKQLLKHFHDNGLPELNFTFLRRLSQLNQVATKLEEVIVRKKSIIEKLSKYQPTLIPPITTKEHLQEYNMFASEKLDLDVFNEKILTNAATFFKVSMTGKDSTCLLPDQRDYLNHYYNEIGQHQKDIFGLKELTLQFGSEKLAPFTVLFINISGDEIKVRRMLLTWNDVLSKYPFLIELLLSVNYENEFTLVVSLNVNITVFAANISKNCQ